MCQFAINVSNIHYMYGLRYEQQQKLLKEEWAKMAQREMEAAKEEMAKATSRERQQTRLEAERTKQLVYTHPCMRQTCFLLKFKSLVSFMCRVELLLIV